MKLTIGCLVVASAVSIAAAASCTPEVASPWPYADEPCETEACAKEQAYADCIALSAVSDGVTCVHRRDLLERAVDLVCTSSETCTLFTDNSLLCLEQFNSNFRDEDGGSGNVFLPFYTMPNGEVTTVTKSTSTATAISGDETTSAPVLASTTEASVIQSKTGTVAGGSQPSVASSSSSQSGTVAAGTQSSGSSDSSFSNAAPTQYTGAAMSRSDVRVGLLAIAALPIVVAAI